MVKAMIREVWQETPDIKFFVLELEKNMPFKAGQFVMVKLDKQKLGKLIPTRAYSIANKPNDKHEIKLIVKIYSEGILSPYLDKLKELDEIELLGPYGRFTLEKDESTEVTLIGAGTGIAPLCGIMEYALTNKTKVNLFYSDKTEKDLINRKWFEELFSNEKINGKLIVTRENKSSLSGRIDKDFLESNLSTKSGIFFVCGPPEFVNQVVKNLEELDIKEENIKTERYD